MEKEVKKIKINRPYIYKAYQVEDPKNLINFSDSKQILANVKNYKFLFKSECHYYVEKFILDFINQNLASAKNYKYLLIKVYDHDLVNESDQIINIYNFLDKINII